jgi:hypothetical protein
MADLIDVLELRSEIEHAGYEGANLNFEAFYDDLVSGGEHSELSALIESRVYQYFSTLRLPEKPTIYDYLVLSLRKKDLIATFNWDPFLLQAYMRNETVSAAHRPRIAFLHGSVMIGVCSSCRVSGIHNRRCGRCGKILEASKLLYPVKHKDYDSDPFVKGEWDCLRYYLGTAYMLTVYGYSAPETDAAARSLMLGVWNRNDTLELAEVEVVDVKPRNEIEKIWSEFFYSHHYATTADIFQSYLFTHPRRSCDAFSAATLMCAPWYDNKYPRFSTLAELQRWVALLVAEEERNEQEHADFSGDPVFPNAKRAVQ